MGLYWGVEFMKLFKIVWQVVILCAISFASNLFVAYTGIDFPGSILGILLLFVLLYFKWLPLAWIESGANFLIAELLLFFIPAAVGIIQFQDILETGWSELLTSIEGSIVFVLIFVGVATEWIVRRKERSSEI